MKARIIVAFIIINIFIFVEGDSQKNTDSNSDNNFSTIELRKKIIKSQRNKFGLDGTSSASQMKNILLRPDEKSKSGTVPEEVEGDSIDEGNRKIIKFANRILESIKRYGIRGKAESFSKSGKYRIDWWKQDRRLERIRKRLFEELERNPELKYRLRSLGWRNSSAPISHQRKIVNDQSTKKNPTNNENDDLKRTVLYKTLITAFKTLMEEKSSQDSKSGQKEPTIFIYMPITITSSTSEINKIKEAALTEFSDPDSPTKFNLNTLDNTDFSGIVTDFGVVDVMSNGMSMDVTEKPGLPSYSAGGQTIDSDRLLQLIPLVVEELRGGPIPEDERRALNWIFGRRLWQLIEREASKRPDETMDQDMAMFLLKGELVERDPNNDLRKRRQRRNASYQRKRKISRAIEVPNRKESNEDKDYYLRDYDFEYVGNYKNNNNDPYTKRSNDLSLTNFDRQVNFHTFIKLASKQESKKLATIINDIAKGKDYDDYDSDIDYRNK